LLLVGSRAVPAIATTAQVLDTGRVVELSSPGTALTTPADGRLRGNDATVTVTGVAWPAAVGAAPQDYVASPGDRLVEFALRITEPANDIGLATTFTNRVSLVLGVGTATLGVDLGGMDRQLYSSSTSDVTAIAVFAAAVPVEEHDVVLEMGENGFPQRFSLWTLRRVPPVPSVLYRSPPSPSVADPTSPTTTLATANPADGFHSDVTVSLSSATLTNFATDGSGTTPPANNEAFLVVQMTSDVPDPSYGSPDWGHYLGNFTALSGGRLLLHLPGRPPIPAIESGESASNTPAGSDSGLLDATYTFTVPADMTTAMLTITPGPATGTEFTGFEGNGSTTNLELTSTAQLPVAFAPSAATPAQHTPPWVGAPLPATGAPASSGTASGGGLPIWLAVLLVVAFGAALVLGERALRRRRAGRGAAAPSTEDPVRANGREPTAKPAQREAASLTYAHEALDGELIVSVLGPVTVSGWRVRPDRRVAEELLCYLALHAGRPMSADEILLALWPIESDRREASRKSLHTYLSGLRQAIGPERLPDASAAGGYRVTGVTTDWGEFRTLVAETRNASDEVAIVLRTDALALVRGAPFQGVPDGRFGWVFAESLVSDMTAAIVEVAHALSTDLALADDYEGAVRAARAGLRGSPSEETLLLDLLRALVAAGDVDGARRAQRDAEHLLGPEAGERLRAAIEQTDHRPSSEA
jgi:DNA-binding SARP family transcriptional activator